MKMPLPARSANAKRPFRGWAKTLAALLYLASGQSAYAAFSESVSVVTPLTFKTMQIPSSGSQTITVSTAGGVSGSGTILYGTTTAGNYTITATGAGQFNNIDIAIANVSIAGCTGVTSVGSFTGNYAGNPVTFPVLGTTTKQGTLLIGATITYGSTVPAGTACAPTFDIQITIH